VFSERKCILNSAWGQRGGVTFLKKVNKIIAITLDWAIGLTVAIIVVVLFVGVVLRYVFSHALFWSEEISVLAMIWMTFLGGVILVREDKNVIITIFADLFKERIQKGIKVFADFLVLIILVTMLYLSWKLTDKLALSTTPALRLSEAWFGWSMIIGFALMLFYQIQRIAAIFPKKKPPVKEEMGEKYLYE
jgi:TRAP-type transport system small permease protein